MYILIVNPEAGNGRAKKVYENLKQDPLYQAKMCRAFFTEYEGHATSLVAHIATMHGDKIKGLIVVGGDGTLYEAINGLTQFPHIKLAFIPAGSGNDFARGCKLEEKGIELFRQILNNPSWQPYWFGVVSKTSKRDEYFATCIGFGFDAQVAKKTNESKYKKLLNRLKLGSLSYVVALIQMLFTFKPKRLELVVDGEVHVFEKAWMVTITNHPYFGGGMKIIPHAKVNSKFLYGLVIDGISKWKVLFLFITVFFGKHINFKEVHTFKASKIEIKAKNGIDYQIDGNTNYCYTCVVSKDSKGRIVNRY